MDPFHDAIRVLHVDDAPDFAEMVSTFLEREDDRFVVEIAENADEARDRIADGDIDCVVSDYDMPGGNGIDLLETVRKTYPRLPFILYTGKGSEEIASEAISAGVTDYLQKGGGPSQYAVLANRITNAVERHQAERELADREQRFSLFFEQSPLGVIEWDETFRLVRMNTAATNILGYTEDDLVGETWQQIVPEADQKRVDTVVSRLLTNKGGFQSTNENVRKDGERIRCEWHNRVVTDETGTVVAVFSQFQDITDRIDRQARLEKTTARLEVLFENSPDMINVDDDDGNILDPNPRLCEETGYTEDELVGMKVWELDSEISPRTAETLWSGMTTGERRKLEGTYRRKDGSTFPVEIHVRRLDLENTSQFVAISRDITERNAREQEQKATIEFIQELYDVATEPAVSADEKITQVLARGQHRLGVNGGYLTRIDATDDEERGRTVVEASGNHTDLEPGATWPLSKTYCRQTIAQDGLLEIHDALAAGWGDDPAYTTSEIGCYIGTPITVATELYGTVFFAADDPRDKPFTDADRTFVRLMAQLVSYELERRQATTALERQNIRLAEFASVVSHDLRNPLAVAKGNIELAREEHDSEHLETAARAHERMDALIADLLALARHGEAATDIIPVDLEKVIQQCWQNVAIGDATLVAHSDRRIHADESRLQQLLENLVRNAIEHGGDDVAITIGLLEDGFYVEDDGPGIPEQKREAVFEAGHSSVENGTGFGLNIAQQVATAHGWEIRLTESDTGGARFELTGVEFVDE